MATPPSGFPARGVPYAVLPGNRSLELDVHRPERAAGAPPNALVVLLHGGGWRLGDRRTFGPFPPCPAAGPCPATCPFRALADAGFVVASLDYRLSGEAVYPAQLDDVLAAVAYLRREAPRWGADPGRVVLWGESAGGHLAALAALALTREPDSGIVGVVDWYGPADLTALADDVRAAWGEAAVVDPSAPDSRESLLLGRPLPEAGELAVAASPARHVHAGAPPFHLAHGTADRIMPYRQSERLAAALTAAGVPVDLVPVAAADHLFRGVPDSVIEQLFDTATTFIRKVTS